MYVHAYIESVATATFADFRNIQTSILYDLLDQ